MDAAPILILVFVWGLAGLLAKASKAAKQQQQQASRSGRPAVQRPGANAPKQADLQPAPQPQPDEGSFYRPTVLQPTITVTEHDDSVYQGSMSADTGEGYDEEFYDSILEETASILPNRTLLWHYRSRHEQLIAFSNAKIYFIIPLIYRILVFC